MKQGDILIINYYFDPIGILIKLFTHSKWNHVAWALNNYMLIEATSRGIVITPISKYLHGSFFNIKLIRFKDLSKTQIKQVTKELVSQRNRLMYFKFFISYWLVLFGIKPLCKNCSNFIYFELKKIGHGISKKNQRFINPEDYNSYSLAKDVTDELPIGT